MLSARANRVVKTLFNRHISTTSVLSKEVGELKWFSKEKGYGFISREDGDKDLFLHWSGFGRSTFELDLPDGLELEFDVEEGQKGPCATNVTRADGLDFDIVDSRYGRQY